MPQPMPERHNGTQCGFMVNNGLLSYQCSLPLGHATVPADDPEPHYAVEAARSVQSWTNWKNRQVQILAQEEAEEQPIDMRPSIACPTCGGDMVIVEETGHGHCMNIDCGVSVAIARAPGGTAPDPSAFVGTIAPAPDPEPEVPVEPEDFDQPEPEVHDHGTYADPADFPAAVQVDDEGRQPGWEQYEDQDTSDIATSGAPSTPPVRPEDVMAERARAIPDPDPAVQVPGRDLTLFDRLTQVLGEYVAPEVAEEAALKARAVMLDVIARA